MAQAPSWPARPIRLVVAYPPGGLSDGIARALADRLAEQLGATVVVENRGGAGGALGLEAVARSAPDGATFGFSSISPLALSPHLGRLGFDPARDIVPVASVMYTPVLLLGTPAFEGAGFADLLAAAKADPGRLRWGTSGPATVGHLMLEQVKAIAGVDITHIPYKGGGQQLTDALAGQFEILSANAAAAPLRQVRAGRFKALAVGAPARLDALPQTPTLAELGFAPANLVSLFGVFAPGRTPEAIVSRMNAEIGRALKVPAIRDRLLAADSVPAPGSAADFARRIAAESEANARIVRSAGIRAE